MGVNTRGDVKNFCSKAKSYKTDRVGPALSRGAVKLGQKVARTLQMSFKVIHVSSIPDHEDLVKWQVMESPIKRHLTCRNDFGSVRGNRYWRQVFPFRDEIREMRCFRSDDVDDGRKKRIVAENNGVAEEEEVVFLRFSTEERVEMRPDIDRN